MKKSNGMNAFGILTGIILFVANFLHSLWSVWLTAEQIDTGWGYGTNMEMAVLYPWFFEVLCIPAFLAGVVFLLMYIWKRSEKWIAISVGTLFACYFLQVILTNLFIFF